MRLYTQAEKDSMADAETLLLNTERLWCGQDAWAARQHGLNWLSGIEWYTHEEAARAASAAFRAVPALRIPDFESEEDKNG